MANKRNGTQKNMVQRKRQHRRRRWTPTVAPLVRGLMSFFMKSVIQGYWDISQGDPTTGTPPTNWTSGIFF